MIQVNIFNYRQKVGKAIRAERRRRDLTQDQLSNHADVNLRTISRIESGNYTRDIKLITIQKICSYLRLTITMTIGDIES